MRLVSMANGNGDRAGWHSHPPTTWRSSVVGSPTEADVRLRLDVVAAVRINSRRCFPRLALANGSPDGFIV